MNNTTAWPRFPAVYEINTRVWLSELAARAGYPLTLDKVPDEEIERIARLGFHAVWLMGVWTTGPEAIAVARTHPDLQNEYRHALPDHTEADIIGSPYAVMTYQVSPQLGGDAALARLRERMARHGLRLILDFVGNHTSRDHRFVAENPDIYIRGSEADLQREPQNFFRAPTGAILAYGRDPYFPGWSDTAQINYFQEPGFQAMKGKLEKIAKQCDGVRCDMAMLLLPDVFERVWGSRTGPAPQRRNFWKEVIPQILQRHPHFVFIAESYWNLEWELQQSGFHFTYDKILYDRLRDRDIQGVRQHLNANLGFQSRCLRFIENHDEPRAATVFGPARGRSAAVVTLFTPGMKLIHEGQMEGRRVKLPVQLGRRPQESEDIETSMFYEKILGVLEDPIFQEASFRPCDVNSAGWNDFSNQNIVAFFWAAPPPRAPRCLGFLIVVNLSEHRSYARVPLPKENFDPGRCPQLSLYDRFDGKRYERQCDELNWPGLYVALESHQAHLFEIAPRE